jgi:hypothetical protein
MAVDDESGQFESGYPSASREAEELRRLRAEADESSRSASLVIARMAEQFGEQARVVELPGDPTFVNAIVFDRPQQNLAASQEPTVRVYRGINKLDASVFKQAAYAMRFREGDAPNMEVQEHLRELVDTLAANPTYANLLRYVEAVWPDLSDKQVRELDRELRDIEDGVLERGFSLRTELTFKTFERTGGFYADTGIAPYLSASMDIKEASGYGTRGVMVVDVPVSKLEALYARKNGEVVVKGSIPPEYISAILVKKSHHESLQSENIPASIESLLPPGTLSREQMEETYRPIRETESRQDAAVRDEDIRLIGERRIAVLRQRYPDALPDPSTVATIRETENVNDYVATKRGMFDTLLGRFVAAKGSKDTLLNHYTYDRHYDFNEGKTVEKKYDRSLVTDEMLERMRQIVLDQEKYMAARARAEQLTS